MKISTIDRTQAIKRSKIYKQDYADYMKTVDYAQQDVHIGSPENYHVRLTMAGKKLCEKWNLVFPVNPHLPDAQDSLNAVIALLDPPEKWKTHTANEIGLGKQKQITHVNGKLVLMIDTSFTHKQIEEAFKKYIKCRVKERSGRERENTLDIWKIYDAYCDKKNMLEVTRNIFKIKATGENLPAYDKRTNSNYEQVKRHYKKASNIIDYIEQQAKQQSM